MELIKIKNLKKSYIINENKKQEVLKDINFTLNSGELVAIVGESGSGKSTLLNIIGGLDTDYQGSVEIDGKQLKGYSGKQLDDYRKQKIGFVFQSFNLISTYTALENILTPANMTTISAEAKMKKAMALIEKFGLGGLENKLPSRLSGGEKQRVAIARALMNDPDIILADEPTGALDKSNAQNLISLLKEIANDGTLVVVVSHSQKVADSCSRVISIEYGVISNDSGEKGFQVKERIHAAPETRKLGFFASISTAYKNIRKNRTRSILVSIGSGIGIFAVVFLLFLSSGMQNYITNQMYSNTNPLVVEVTKTTTRAGAAIRPAQQIALIARSDPFSQEEINSLSSIAKVSSIETSSIVVQSTKFTIEDVSDNIALLSTVNRNFAPALKVGIMPKEGQILISESVAQSIGGDINGLIGKAILVEITIDKVKGQIGTKSFEISGIIENDGSPVSRFKSAYISFSDLKEIYSPFSEVNVSSVFLAASSTKDVDSIKSAVADLGFTANRQDAAIERILGFLNIITLGLTGVAAVSLVVSGIMILVVLFISVVERTKEIGTLRAIGARKMDIKKIFISEGLLLGVGGGIAGGSLSVLAGTIVNWVLARMFGVSLIHVNLPHVLLGMAISISISVVASLIPAEKASRLDPIVALRYE